MSVLRYEPLPDTLFLVRVPIVATYSDAEISLLGLPITINHGDNYGSNQGEYNYSAYKELTTVMLPITRLVDIYCGGHKIVIVNRSDIPVIYEILEKYLMGVTAAQTYSLNRALIEEDRMEDIERFASEMFGINKSLIAKTVYDQMNKDGFNLDMNFMTPAEAYDAKQKVVQSNKVTNTPMTFTTTKPNTHLGYPYLPQSSSQQNSAINSSNNTTLKKVKPEDLYGAHPTTDNISYVYNKFPTFDLNKVERKPNSYRKTFTIT